MAQTSNLFLRNGVYYGRFFENGKLKRASLQTSDLEEAKTRVEIMITRASMIKYGRIKPNNGDLIYFIHDRDLHMMKVGISSNLDSRVRSLKANTASDVVLLGSVSGSSELEKVLHRFLAPFHHRREWFRAPQPVLAFVQSLIKLEHYGIENPKPIPTAMAHGTKTVSEVSIRVPELAEGVGFEPTIRVDPV